MNSLRIVPKSFEQLRALASPASTRLPETLPDVLYDTQSYLIGGVAALNFFTAVNADTTLCNLEAAGMLPAPQYFEIHKIFVDFHYVTTHVVGGATGALFSLETLLKTARGTFTFTMKNKNWGPIPLTFFGGSGGLHVAVDGGAATEYQYADMGDNGGFPVNGTIVIPPNTQFRVQLGFVSTAITAATNIRVSFLGVKHRLVA